MNMICMKPLSIWHFIFIHKFEIQFIIVSGEEVGQKWLLGSICFKHRTSLMAGEHNVGL